MSIDHSVRNQDTGQYLEATTVINTALCLEQRTAAHTENLQETVWWEQHGDQ